MVNFCFSVAQYHVDVCCYSLNLATTFYRWWNYQYNHWSRSLHRYYPSESWSNSIRPTCRHTRRWRRFWFSTSGETSSHHSSPGPLSTASPVKSKHHRGHADRLHLCLCLAAAVPQTKSCCREWWGQPKQIIGISLPPIQDITKRKKKMKAPRAEQPGSVAAHCFIWLLILYNAKLLICH